MHIFCTVACPARPVAGRFSRSRLRGTQGGRMYTKAQVWGPGRAPWRVLWAFEVAQSGKQSQGRFPPRRASHDSGAAQFGTGYECIIFLFLLWFCCRCCCCIMSITRCCCIMSFITPPLKLSRSLLSGSHGTMAVAH